MGNCRCNYNNTCNNTCYKGYYNIKSGGYANKVFNGGMEESFAMDTETRNWETCGCVVRTDIPSLVHTGEYAAMLSEGAAISQTMFRIGSCRPYEFSFFAKYGSRKMEKKDGDDSDGKDSDGKDGSSSKDKKYEEHRKDLGLTAMITYITHNMRFDVVQMEIPAGSLSDDYVYYRAVAPMAPPDVVAAIVTFCVSEPKIRPHVPHHLGVLIDDVAFTKL